MLTHIYQSQNQPSWYLVLPVNQEEAFARVPPEVLTELGELQKLENPELGPGSLGIDLLQAKNDFDILGYHLAKPEVR